MKKNHQQSRPKGKIEELDFDGKEHPWQHIHDYSMTLVDEID
jgi:hypothetical protein